MTRLAEQPTATTTVTDLNTLLADYQVHYQRLRSYHWNVKGPMFFQLHAKFEEMYLDAALKVDALAERVLAVGGMPFSTLAEQLRAARLSETSGDLDAGQMVGQVLADLDHFDGVLRESATAAEQAGDRATANMLEEMADGQEQTAWMLRAYLG